MMLRGFLFAHRRELMAAALLLLPPVLLIPLGTLWLWQQGHGLWFLALCLVGAMPAGVLILRRRVALAPPDLTDLPEPEADWPAREREAFERVKRFAEATEPLSLEKRDEALSLARRTVQLVATHYRSDAAMPLAAFTMPEALLLVERVSSRLRRTMLDMFPFSDRLTFAQLLWAYESTDRAKSLIKVGGNVYGAYRALRPVINPAGAILSEAQRMIFDAAWGKGKDYLQRKLTHLLVLEVGKAAIELYSGRLKHKAIELDEIAATAAREGTSAAGEMPPLRILIAGQINAGKSSLLNALSREILAPVTPLPGPAGFSCFEGSDPDGRAFVFVDAPGLVASADATAALAEEARKADIVLWTIAAHQPARDADVQGLKAFREWFAARPELNRPPLLCVATHVDQLRPFAEWAPPYDIVAADRPKARAIREAVQAIAVDLGISAGSIVPVSLRPDSDAYNLDTLRARIAACLPDARYAQLSRAGSSAGKASWRKELGRLLLAGRTLFGASD
jgi:predicted GTPase